MKMKKLMQASAIISAAFLSACTVGSDYVRPDVKTAESWATQSENLALTANTQTLASWWQQFDDPLLERLVNKAIDNNLDINIARTRLREARAGRRLARASMLPQLNSSAAYQRQSFSQERASSEAGLSNAGLIERDNDYYELGFDASFEIDLFGGNRRKLEAATARRTAAAEAINEVQAAVVAELGRAYLEIRGLQFERQTLQQNIDAQRSTLEITRQNKQAGLATAFDVDRSTALLESSRAQLPALDARIDANSYAIGLLTGELPDTWLAELKDGSARLELPRVVAAGLPPELLRRRPDIRRSERELAAATADVGVAIANLYPKFFLSGLGAFQSDNTGSLLSASAWAFSIGPMVQLPIFQGGRLRANVDSSKASKSQAELNYEKTILNALTEVETRLTEYGNQQRALASLEQAVAAARSAAERAGKLQRDGLGSFLDVLDAERELRDIENEFARQRTATAVTLIALYKSLGGGWNEQPIRQG